MSQSFSQTIIHLVFSTKHREPLISPGIEAQLHGYLASTCRAIGSNAFRIGGCADHIHIACSLPRTLSISDLLQEIKRSSSVWMKEQGAEYRDFAWQNGYGAFSIGYSQLDRLLHYIDTQHEHHKKESFKEEFLSFLKKYNIEYKEEYLWD